MYDYPIFVCLLFIFILATILIGLYFGLDIRWHLMRRRRKKNLMAHSKNVLTVEDMEKYASRKPQSKNTDGEKRKAERELKREQKRAGRSASKPSSSSSGKMKDRIGEKKESLIGFQCELEGSDPEEKTKEKRSGQDEKYGYVKRKKEKENPEKEGDSEKKDA